MAYTKFGSPEAEDAAPQASSSKMNGATSTEAGRSTSHALPQPNGTSTSSKKRARSPSLTNGALTNGNGHVARQHTVSYHQSDDEDENEAGPSTFAQPMSKKQRRKAEAAHANGTDTAVEREKMRNVADKLRKERMDLPIWSGTYSSRRVGQL